MWASDVLDQFTPPPPKPPPPSATIPASAFPITSPPDDDDLNSEFAKELQKGMESLMREMGGLGGGADGDGVLDGAGGFGGGKKTAKEKEQERAFRAAWEAMLVEGMDGMVAPSSSALAPTSASPSASGVPGKENEKGKEKEKEVAEGTDPSKQDFQAGIRAAFEKLKSSESGLQVRPSPFPSSLQLTPPHPVRQRPTHLHLHRPARNVPKPAKRSWFRRRGGCGWGRE
jgi:peroxin-19